MLASQQIARALELHGAGRLSDAERLCREILEHYPGNPDALHLLGVITSRRGNFKSAASLIAEAIHHDPSNASYHSSQGIVLQEQRAFEDALAAYDEALGIEPEYAEAHNNRGVVLQEQSRFKEALAAYDETLRIKPDFARAHNNRGIILQKQGKLEEALAAYEEAMRIKPDFAAAHSNYLFCLNYDPSQDDESLSGAHRAWGARYGHPRHAFTTYANARDVDKTLRVGLVSADLGRHPTGYFLDAVLEAADPARMQFVCYSGRAKEDDLTERFRAHAHGWRSSIGVPDRQLAAAIRADAIDILIDLSGHTAVNRLTCFALKPAPVQVTWLGSCHTTGVPAIDYILMDPTYVPEGGERWFTEKVVRLPDIRWCYAPPEYAPEVADPPILRRGHITFGCFNNLTKINPDVINLWARVLKAVPGSRLLLNWTTLADPDERQRIEALWKACDIPSDRLELTKGAESHAGVLGEYAGIDVALDPFPFSGCLTTCEVLWMGVPLVTLPNTRPASRQTLGFLSMLGRTEWVAKDPEDYIRIAADLAGDAERLSALRQQQRVRVAASPMCDAPRFARNLEAALRDMWGRWCESGADLP